MAEVGEMFINEGLAAARDPFLGVDTKIPARCMVNADVGTSRHMHRGGAAESQFPTVREKTSWKRR